MADSDDPSGSETSSGPTPELMDAMNRARREAEAYRRKMPPRVPPGPERDRMVDKAMAVFGSGRIDWQAIEADYRSGR